MLIFTSRNVREMCGNESEGTKENGRQIGIRPTLPVAMYSPAIPGLMCPLQKPGDSLTMFLIDGLIATWFVGDPHLLEMCVFPGVM